MPRAALQESLSKAWGKLLAEIWSVMLYTDALSEDILERPARSLSTPSAEVILLQAILYSSSVREKGSRLHTTASTGRAAQRAL